MAQTHEGAAVDMEIDFQSGLKQEGADEFERVIFQWQAPRSDDFPEKPLQIVDRMRHEIEQHTAARLRVVLPGSRSRARGARFDLPANARLFHSSQDSVLDGFLEFAPSWDLGKNEIDGTLSAAESGGLFDLSGFS